MKYVIYLRVSTDQQANSGLGIEAQKHLCLNYIKNKPHDSFEIFKDDGYSGSLEIEKRPDLRKALDSLVKGDILLVAKRDRLGRDVLINLLIEKEVAKKKCQIETASGEFIDNNDPANVLMRTIIDGFSKHEIMMTKARTKAALAVKKRRGERTGYIPYGYRVKEDKIHLDVDPKEQDTILLIKDLHKTGLTYRGIAMELNSLGVLNRKNKPWSHVAVFELIKKSTYLNETMPEMRSELASQDK